MSGLFARLQGRSRDYPAPLVPPDTRVYSIGDIHGRLDLLDALHERIERDREGFSGRTEVVYLGDYVDRGEQSQAVIQRLLDDPLGGCRVVHLRGNHEQAMLDFLEYPDHAAGWLSYGGMATLASYGVGCGTLPGAAAPGELAQQLQQQLPDSHLAFLQQTRLYHTIGNYCFVHAGIRPGLPLQEQHPEDLLWIRQEFLDDPGPHPFIVVHGHTPVNRVECLPQRVGLDTGAYFSDVLSCLVLESDTQRLLQT